MSNLPTWRTGQAIRTRSLPIIGTKHGARVSASCRAGRLVYTTAGLATSTLDDDHHAAAEALARRLGWIDTDKAPKGARLYSGTLANGDGVHLITCDGAQDTEAAKLREELRDGIERVKMLVARWEGGDLAEAVTTLESWADFAESAYFPEGVANPYDAEGEGGETE